MLRGRGNGPEHGRARRWAHEATVRGLVAGAVAEAHAALAAVLHHPAGSARAFLTEAALPAIQALNGVGALTLLLAMHGGVNAVRLRLLDLRQPSMGTRWSGARPTSRAGPCQ